MKAKDSKEMKSKALFRIDFHTVKRKQELRKIQKSRESVCLCKEYDKRLKEFRKENRFS